MEMILYHYYEKEIGPFRNLSSLNMDEAYQIMEQIKFEGKGFASKRSDDYLFIRRELEQQARKLFIDKGGKPTNSYPHYMTVGSCEWIKGWYLTGAELSLHIKDLNEKSLSFTYGDLFPTMRFQDGKPYRGQVYTLTEIIYLINHYGLPQDWNPDGSKGPERYIEVQIWDDEVIKFIK